MLGRPATQAAIASCFATPCARLVHGSRRLRSQAVAHRGPTLLRVVALVRVRIERHTANDGAEEHPCRSNMKTKCYVRFFDRIRRHAALEPARDRLATVSRASRPTQPLQSWTSSALIAAAGLAVGCRGPADAAASGVSEPPLARHYVAGETVRYVMTGVNQGRDSTRTYTAESEAIVEREQDGTFFEDTRWIHLEVDGREVALDEKSLAFRQHLSLDPRHAMPFPDIRGVNPMLIGPVFDLMTFYVDLHPALSKGRLVHAGDHVYVPHPQANSWADGVRILVGQDRIDFDLTLVDAGDRAAHLRVRHVPPPEPGLELPAEWMGSPVGDGPNNWVQVEKVARSDPAEYVAAVGRESFDVDLNVERPSGRIVSATMDNPVDVVEMRCRDAALKDCTDRARYRIQRRIELRQRP